MRIASGSPKSLFHEPGSPLLFARSNKGLLVTASASSLFLWSMKPQVILTKVQRSEKHVAEQGEFEGIVWKSDYSAFLAWTTKGHILIYEVQLRTAQERVLEFQFKNEFYYMSGPGETKGLSAWTISLVNRISAPSEFACGYSLANHFCLMSKQGEIEIRDWMGVPHYKISVKDVLIQIFGKAGPELVWVTSVHPLDAHEIIWLLSDGRALIIRFLLAEKSWKGAEIRGTKSQKISCVAYNQKFHSLAIGFEDGTIEVSSIGDLNVTLLRELSLKLEKIYTPKPVGRVSCLEWTQDGQDLGIGWANQGFAIWSFFGKLVSSSLLHRELHDIEDDDAQTLIFNGGVLGLTWGPESYDLFFLLKASQETPNTLAVLSFHRPSTSFNLSQQNTKYPVLVGDNSLQISIGQMAGVDVTSPEVQYWRQVQMPANYLTENWPISFVASSGDGRSVAIAGRRGFAHYNMATNKWKLFNNVQHEREFRCRGGLVWLNDILVVACQDVETLHFELRFYWQSGKLDKGCVLHTKALPSLVIHMAAQEDVLLVYSADNVLREFLVQPLFLHSTQDSFAIAAMKSLKMTVLRETQLQGHFHPFSVQSITWLSGIGQEQIPLHLLPLVVLEAGSLYLLHRSEAPQKKLIGKGVERFLVAPLSASVDQFNTVVWIFDKEGLLLWTHDPKQPEPTLSRIIVNFSPLAILIGEGFLMGVSQEVNVRRVHGQSLISFRTVTENLLFLPTILRILLKKSQGNEAVVFARGFKELQYFGHSLEILLHEVLEDQKETQEGVVMLQKAIQLIEQFPHFLDVVMSVARKTEANSWQYFFNIAGDPQELLEMCLETGRLRTACSYLSILQNLEEKPVSRKEATRLLETALYTEEFDIAQEIVDFLRKLDALVDKESDETESKLFLDVLLSRHARLLLQNNRIRAFGQFSKKLDFPLVPWLQKERNRAAVVRDLAGAFNTLHKQFNWPFPEDENVITIFESPKRLSAQHPKSLRQRKEEDIWAILQPMIEGKCSDWTILLGSMVAHLDAVVLVFREDPSRLPEFIAMIEQSKSSGYQKFSQKVQEALSSS